MSRRFPPPWSVEELDACLRSGKGWHFFDLYQVKSSNSDASMVVRRGRTILVSRPMDQNLTDDAKCWRIRADEARAIGVQMTDPHTRAVMFSIAQDYEKLAQRAELRAQKSL